MIAGKCSGAAALCIDDAETERVAFAASPCDAGVLLDPLEYPPAPAAAAAAAAAAFEVVVIGDAATEFTEPGLGPAPLMLSAEW